MTHRLEQVSITPTLARQTQQKEFGNVLKDTLEHGAALAGNVLVAGTGGIPILSAAVSAVSGITSLGRGGGAAQAATGIQSVGTTVPGVDVATSGGGSIAGGGSVNDMMSQMRREADRSLMLQMQMQEESREYNMVSNVLKTRHDSAKAAINNIR